LAAPGSPGDPVDGSKGARRAPGPAESGPKKSRNRLVGRSDWWVSQRQIPKLLEQTQ